MIVKIASGSCPSGDSRAKKTVALNSLGRDRLLGLLIQDDVDLSRVRPENADLQIVPDPVWPQNSERIGMFAREKTGHFIGWQTRNFERLHFCFETLMLIASTSDRFNESFRLRSSSSRPKLLPPARKDGSQKRATHWRSAINKGRRIFIMATVVKVIEVLSQSPKSWEDAAQGAVNEASKTLRNIRSIYVKELTAEVENGKISNYRVNAKVSFDLETERSK
jgi:dodecin